MAFKLAVRYKKKDVHLLTNAKKGHKNTRYFHKMANEYNNRNYMAEIKIDGQ